MGNPIAFQCCSSRNRIRRLDPRALATRLVHSPRFTLPVPRLARLRLARRVSLLASNPLHVLSSDECHCGRAASQFRTTSIEEERIKKAMEEEQQANSTMEEGRRGKALPSDGDAADGAEGDVTVTSVQALLDRRQAVPSPSVVSLHTPTVNDDVASERGEEEQQIPHVEVEIQVPNEDMVPPYIPGGYTSLLMGVDQDAITQTAIRKLYFDESM